MFPSNVAKLGWLLDTSCPDREYGGAEVLVGAEVGVGVEVSGGEVTSEEVLEADVEGETTGTEIPRAVQQVVYYQAGVGSRGSWLPRTLDGTIPPKLRGNVLLI